MITSVHQTSHVVISSPDTPLSLTRTMSSRHFRDQPSRNLKVDFEGTKVAVIHADNIGARSEADIQFRLVVHFDDRSHFKVLRQFAKAPQRRLIEHCGDKKNRIRPVSRGFDHMKIVNREILPQYGQRNGCPCRFKIAGSP